MTRSPIDPHPVSARRGRRAIARIGALALGLLAVVVAALSVWLMVVIQQEYGLTTGDAIFCLGGVAMAASLGFLGWLLWHRLG